MDITRLAIDRDRVTIVLLAVLVFAGVNAYRNMPKAEDPGFLIRTAVVITRFPGASPERVEQLVTDKLEKAIQELPELDTVKSTSKTGISIINVDVLESYTDLQPIWDNLRRKVERVAGDLPAGVIGPTVDDEFGDVFGTVLTLAGDGYSQAELFDVADEVRDELLLIPEVAKVELYGVQEERIFVEYDNARLADLGVSPGMLQSALQSRNIIDPGGTVRDEHEQIVIEPSGNFETLEELGRALIPTPGGALLYLEDVATIRRDYVDPPQVRMHVDGERGIGIAISLRAGGNILDLGAAVRSTVERLQTVYPHGIELRTVLDQAQIVDKKVDDFASNLLQSIAIVLAVMLISLGLRTGLVVATLIPMAIVTAFLFMPLADVGIDQMSLAALIIALGLLVDNAIVMSENVLVQMQEGKPALEAAVDSARELRASLLISSLTTAAAFLPIFLAESAVGEYTGALFKVVTITLLCSWVLALTMIPLLCVRFLRVKNTEGGAYESRFYRGYRAGLLAVLRHPLLSLAAVVLAFLGSFQLFALVPKIFFPDNDRPTFTAQLYMPTGTPLEATELVVDQIEEFIAGNLMETDDSGGVLDFTSFIGDSAPMFVLGFAGSMSSPEYAVTILNSSDWPSVAEAAAKLQAFCATIPGLEATVEAIASGPGGGTPVEVRVSGRGLREVLELSEEVRGQLAEVPGTRNVTDDWGARTKKMRIEVDQARAQRAGVTHQDVAISLLTRFSGIETTRFREDDMEIPVILRSADGGDARRLSSINVFAQSSGRSVPADQVGGVALSWQPSKILRRDRLRTVTVGADLAPGLTANEINTQIVPWLEEASQSWPAGYGWELGGENEDSDQANQSIADKLPIAGMLIVLLLVVQFNSLRKPLIILLTVPLAFIGVAIGLLVMRSYFGFMTLLGIVSLAGIVINNAIVLIDRIQLEIDELGRTPAQAVIEAAQRRFRPILLTTFTTLGGMVPLYLGGGPMFEPLAVAIMFGLVFATVLTLGVVPLLYSLLYRVSFRDFRYEHLAVES